MNTLLTVIVAGGSGQRMGSTTPKQFIELDGKPIIMHTIERMAHAVERWIDSADPQVLTTTTHITDCVVNNDANVVNNDIDNTVINNPDIVHNNIDNTVINNVINSDDNTVINNVDNIVNNTTGKLHINHHIVLVLPTDHMDTWQELCRIHNFRHQHTVVQGGETRFHSVRNGLAILPAASIVLVHDGVRPFVTDRAVGDAIDAAIQHGAAIPAVEVTDSLRLVDTNGGSQAVDRATYRAVQTPQVFRGSVLRNAYLTPYRSRFTDDASVVENSGHTVKLTHGDATNIKITTPTDLIIAQELIKQQRHS